MANCNKPARTRTSSQPSDDSGAMLWDTASMGCEDPPSSPQTVLAKDRIHPNHFVGRERRTEVEPVRRKLAIRYWQIAS